MLFNSIIVYYVLNLLKSTGAVFNSLISKSSISDIKLVKSSFIVNCEVSTPVAFFKSDFVT